MVVVCALDGAGMAGNDASQGLKERLINMHQRKGKTDPAPKPCCQCIPQRNRKPILASTSSSW